jgi:3-deoxy-D-manno-octulosonate 8-phosphate phosphatase (KDO 8-P phosphatase)
LKSFILDVDGVLTDGCFWYTAAGKVSKKFGPDDADALKIISSYLEVLFVSADQRGFGISEARVNDMGFELFYVKSDERLSWLQRHYELSETIYMGDGIYDGPVLKACAYGICPSNGSSLAKKAATYITVNDGGDRAVADACIHILEMFFPQWRSEFSAISDFL